MRVTIITVVYNGAETISDCISSVLAQDYADKEYIIIDGQSSDQTMTIVNSFGDRINKVVSERDGGIYDAMNKGIALASGEIIGILNADDVFAYSGVLTDVVKLMEASHADAVYGDLVYTDRVALDKVVRRWISGKYREGDFYKGWMPPHPSFFLKLGIYEKFGKFRTDLGSSCDYELMLRMIEKHRIKLSYLNKVLVKMRSGGVSNQSLDGRWAANRNDKKAWAVNNLRPGFFTLILKPIRKIFQFWV